MHICIHAANQWMWHVIILSAHNKSLLNVEHISQTILSTHRWCAPILQLLKRQPRQHYILVCNFNSFLVCGMDCINISVYLSQQNVLRNLICEVCAYC